MVGRSFDGGGFALGVKTGNLPEPAMGEMRAAKLELVLVWLCVFSTYTAAVSVSTRVPTV